MRTKLVSIAIGILLLGGAFVLIFPNQFGTRSNLNSPSPSPTSPSPSPTSPSPSPTSPSPSPTSISLLCLNKTTYLLRTSNVLDQCRATESSLGAYRIPIPVQRPTDLNPFLRVRYLAAQVAARRVGIKLALTSGFRSYASQEKLFAEALKKYGSVAKASKWVLPPDLSHHVLGLALDINYPNDPTSTMWLEENGSRFGMCRVYLNEWWHFEGATAPGGICPAMVVDATVALLAD